jgi:hypothetical protein
MKKLLDGIARLRDLLRELRDRAALALVPVPVPVPVPVRIRK